MPEIIIRISTTIPDKISKLEMILSKYRNVFKPEEKIAIKSSPDELSLETLMFIKDGLNMVPAII